MKRSEVQSFPPLTATRPAMLRGGRDDDFRRVIQDLVDFSSRLSQIRETLARQVGISPPQYKLLMELAHWSKSKPAVSDLAMSLGVTLPFVTTETSRLETAGLVRKSTNSTDKRRVDLALTEKGKKIIGALAPAQRAVNDTLFREFSAGDMKTIGRFARALLAASADGLVLAGRPFKRGPTR